MYYSYLATHFPGEQERGGGALAGGLAELSAGTLAEAARLFDEQIRLYPQDTETAAALYWRGRLHETQDHKPALAAADYRAVVRAYQHFFYAQMARERLAALGMREPVSAAADWSASSRRRCRSWWTAFRPTARTWPRRGCWPTRA